MRSVRFLAGSFLALFLAFAKRRHELGVAASAGSGPGHAHRKVLDQYSVTFLDQMINVVTASTLLSYALYTVAPETAERLGLQYANNQIYGHLGGQPVRLFTETRGSGKNQRTYTVAAGMVR